MFFHSPCLASFHIVIETLSRVDVESAVVLPLVGVSNLHIEGRELPMGVGLGLGTHPRLGINALSESHAQVFDELLHHLLGTGREVTLAINLAQSLAHGRLCVVGGTLPQRIVFLATAQSLAEEVEVGLAHLVGEVAGRTHYHVPLHCSTQVVGCHG